MAAAATRPASSRIERRAPTLGLFNHCCWGLHSADLQDVENQPALVRRIDLPIFINPDQLSMVF